MREIDSKLMEELLNREEKENDLRAEKEMPKKKNIFKRMFERLSDDDEKDEHQL